MDDAGGEHVADHAREVEAEGAWEVRREDADFQQKALLRANPARWWFASSAFPMIAGTLGPVASAFSICALVRPWRQHFLPGTNIREAPFILDPDWLTAINAIQLVIALVANLCLLLNMARKLKFTWAMPITIVGWYVSSITLIALTATAAGPLLVEPVQDYVWSQAFFYGVFSALLYFIVASLLVVTAWGASTGRYDKDFQLTTSQRTLMLQTILFLMYLLLGALIFSTIEGWAYLDAVYFADVTLFTVGFGDMGATTTLGRALLFPYALVGVISLGLVIGSIRSLVLERGRHMLDARMFEKKRRTVLRRMTLRGEDDILRPIREDSGMSSLPPSGGPPELIPSRTRTLPFLKPSRRITLPGEPVQQVTTELERREKEFRLMRHIQRLAAKRRRWWAMAMSSGTWVVLWLVGARVFQSCEESYEGWSYFDSVYFAFVSLTTIGYGDKAPTSNAGRTFFVFWSLLALPTTTVLISNAGDTVIKSIRDFTNQVGNITILPGEAGLTKDVKAVLKSLSCGILFAADDDHIREMPPGFLGESGRRDVSGTATEDEGEDDDGGGDEKEEARRAKEADAALKADEENALGEEGSGGSGGGTTEGTGEGGGGEAEEEEEDEEDEGEEEAEEERDLTATPTVAAIGDEGKKSKKAVKIKTKKKSAKIAQAPVPRGPDFTVAIPTDRTDYLVLLADEIGRVSRHMKHHPPCKYTYAEWAWYLKLMGEDESSAETHRQARPHLHKHHHVGLLGMLHLHHGDQPLSDTEEGGPGGGGGGAGAGSGGGEQEGSGGAGAGAEEQRQQQQGDGHGGKVAWSWVGARSPLMGAHEESEWIHERLVRKLTAELRSMRDDEKHSKNGGAKEPE